MVFANRLMVHLRRGYLYENWLHTPKIVKGKLQECFDEYNSYARYSALKIKTLQESYNFKTAP